MRWTRAIQSNWRYFQHAIQSLPDDRREAKIDALLEVAKLRVKRITKVSEGPEADAEIDSAIACLNSLAALGFKDWAGQSDTFARLGADDRFRESWLAGKTLANKVTRYLTMQTEDGEKTADEICKRHLTNGTNLPKEPGQAQFDIAAIYAGASNSLTSNDPPVNAFRPEGEAPPRPFKQRYAETAFLYLHQAVDAGFKDWDTLCSDFGDLTWDDRFDDTWLNSAAVDAAARHFMGLRTREGNDRAVRLFTRRIKENPDDVWAWINRGVVNKRLLKLDDAERDYQTAFAMHNTDARPHAVAAIDLAYLYDSQGKRDAAEKYFELSIKADDTYVEPLTARAEFYRQQKNWGAAITDLQSAALINDESNAELAAIYFSRGDDTQGQATLKSYLDRNPDNAKAYLAAGGELFENSPDRYLDQAIEYLTTAVTKLTDADTVETKVNIYSKLGAAYRRQRKYDLALTAYDRALDASPTDEWTLAERGGVQVLYGKFAEALDTLNRALAEDPDDQWAFEQRGDAKLALGDTDGAALDYQRAADLRADQSQAYGRLLIQIGRLDEARAPLHKFLNANPNDVPTLLFLGLIDRMQHAKGDGNDLFAQVDRLPANDADGMTNRALARAYLGRFDGAFQDTTDAEKSNGDTGSINRNYSFLYAARSVDPQAQPTDRTTALYYLAKCQTPEPDAWTGLGYPTYYKPLVDDPDYKLLIESLKLPMDDPARFIKLARFYMRVANRMTAAKDDRGVSLYDQIYTALTAARAVNWQDDPAIENDPDFAPIIHLPEFETAVHGKPEPATQP